MRTGAAGAGGLGKIDGMIQGVNYASAAAGIISSSGSELVYICFLQSHHPYKPDAKLINLAASSTAMILLTNLFGCCPLIEYCCFVIFVVIFIVLQGMHVSLTQQVQQVEDTYEQLSLALGEAAAANLFKRSVFFVSIGSNDFIHYYLRNVSGVQMRYLPWEFNKLLVSTMRQEIKVLSLVFRLFLFTRLFSG
jgi:hypothetical protein